MKNAATVDGVAAAESKVAAKIDHEATTQAATHSATKALGRDGVIKQIDEGAEEAARDLAADAGFVFAELRKIGAKRVRRAGRAGVAAAVAEMTGKR